GKSTVTLAAMRRSRSMSRAVVPVVPWSVARMYLDMATLRRRRCWWLWTRDNLETGGMRWSSGRGRFQWRRRAVSMQRNAVTPRTLGAVKGVVCFANQIVKGVDVRVGKRRHPQTDGQLHFRQFVRER